MEMERRRFLLRLEKNQIRETGIQIPPPQDHENLFVLEKESGPSTHPRRLLPRKIRSFIPLARRTCGR